MYVDIASGEPRLMPKGRIFVIYMMGASLAQVSAENKVRAVPARVNFTKLDSWNNGDMATVVQAHYALSGASN